MKNPLDPRHKKRQKAVEDLFKLDFKRQTVGDFAKEIFSKKELIDLKISEAAPEYPINKINKTDLAILRLAVYELLIKTSQPAKVIIDEAVELAKEYGGDSSPAFINGALGKLIEK
jgi:transcription antitermination protein NusB